MEFQYSFSILEEEVYEMSVRAILMSTPILILSLLAACGDIGTQLPEHPLLYSNEIRGEIERIKGENAVLIPGLVEFDSYPKVLGIDGRNGFILLEDYICWRSCPGVGAIFLIYQDVPDKTKCEEVGGLVVRTPVAMPGVEPDDYFGCIPKTS